MLTTEGSAPTRREQVVSVKREPIEEHRRAMARLGGGWDLPLRVAVAVDLQVVLVVWFVELVWRWAAAWKQRLVAARVVAARVVAARVVAVGPAFGPYWPAGCVFRRSGNRRPFPPIRIQIRVAVYSEGKGSGRPQATPNFRRSVIGEGNRPAIFSRLELLLNLPTTAAVYNDHWSSNTTFILRSSNVALSIRIAM